MFEESQEADELVIGAVSRMIKALDTFRNEYLGQFRRLESYLCRNSRELYGLMKNGPANMIKPKLVVDVLESSN